MSPFSCTWIYIYIYIYILAPQLEQIRANAGEQCNLSLVTASRRYWHSRCHPSVRPPSVRLPVRLPVRPSVHLGICPSCVRSVRCIHPSARPVRSFCPPRGLVPGAMGCTGPTQTNKTISEYQRLHQSCNKHQNIKDCTLNELKCYSIALIQH